MYRNLVSIQTFKFAAFDFEGDVPDASRAMLLPQHVIWSPSRRPGFWLVVIRTLVAHLIYSLIYSILIVMYCSHFLPLTVSLN